MCSQYFLELKMLMEMEDRIDYLFELELQKRITYYPSNQIPVIKMNNNQLTGDLVKWGYRLFDNKLPNMPLLSHRCFHVTLILSR